MNTRKLEKVTEFYRTFIIDKKKYNVPDQIEDYDKKFSSRSENEVYKHLLYMLIEMKKVHIPNGKIEKSMRWLGFIQGMLFCLGDFSLEDLKNHSKPDDNGQRELFEKNNSIRVTKFGGFF